MSYTQKRLFKGVKEEITEKPMQIIVQSKSGCHMDALSTVIMKVRWKNHHHALKPPIRRKRRAGRYVQKYTKGVSNLTAHHHC